jgi:hypothetical protein
MFPLSVTSFRVPSVEQIICFCENRKSWQILQCDRTEDTQLNIESWWSFSDWMLLTMSFKWKYYVFYENFTRADVKERLYLIKFKFPAKHAGCYFSLISDVTPSIPIYLFNCIKAIVSFLEFRNE